MMSPLNILGFYKNIFFLRIFPTTTPIEEVNIEQKNKNIIKKNQYNNETLWDSNYHILKATVLLQFGTFKIITKNHI